VAPFLALIGELWRRKTRTWKNPGVMSGTIDGGHCPQDRELLDVRIGVETKSRQTSNDNPNVQLNDDHEEEEVDGREPEDVCRVEVRCRCVGTANCNPNVLRKDVYEGEEGDHELQSCRPPPFPPPLLPSLPPCPLPPPLPLPPRHPVEIDGQLEIERPGHLAEVYQVRFFNYLLICYFVS